MNQPNSEMKVQGTQDNDMTGVDQNIGSDLSSSESDDSNQSTNWVSWFCCLKGNEFFCEIDVEYIQDNFNLTGLSSLVPYYDFALDMILDVDPDDQLSEEQRDVIDNAAEMLYGLIHARFIITSRGMEAMREKFNSSDFGRCYRVLCHGQQMLPVGQSDKPEVATVYNFCPRCRNIFFPKSSRQGSIDGAYFGTTFAHLFLLNYSSMLPSLSSSTVVDEEYTPRIFGFRIHESSSYWRNTTKHKPLPNSSNGKLRRNSSGTNHLQLSTNKITSSYVNNYVPEIQPNAWS